MKMRQIWFTCIIIIMFFCLSLVGCSSIEKSKAVDTQRLLSASGFKMQSADTPEQLENIKEMSQRKLVRHERDGAVEYFYADAIYCKCLYVGTEEDYEKFKQIETQHRKENTVKPRQISTVPEWDRWGDLPGANKRDLR